MKRQRTLYQMKEQDKTPEKELNEVEIDNLAEKEFRIGREMGTYCICITDSLCYKADANTLL